MSRLNDISRDFIKGLRHSNYSTRLLTDDLVASFIVTVLLVPQALAYALLADLPPQVGLYASVLPLVAYAIFGSSRYLAVGPIAIASLMTAEALAQIDPELRVPAAALLALMSGFMLSILGLLRMGTISNFLSRPVVSGVISGTAILIILSQLKHIFGIEASGGTIPEAAMKLYRFLPEFSLSTTVLGLAACVLLFGFRKYVSIWLRLAGIGRRTSRMLARLGPVVVIIIAAVSVFVMRLNGQSDIAIIGDVPEGLPPFRMPLMDLMLLRELFVPALLISLVGYVDSISVAQNMASKRRHRVDPDRELLGQGAANVVAGLNGGYPVSGSLSRSAVNFQAGAATKMAGVFSAIMMAFTLLFFTPYLYFLPLAALAAMIIVACFSLFEFRELFHVWEYNRTDGLTAFATLAGVLLLGIEIGVLIGVILSILLYIRSTVKPHAVIVGKIAGTQHYRDVKRHDIDYHPDVITLRVDESLYFANARFLEDTVAQLVSEHPKLTDLVLMCPAVNQIDASALESLKEINLRLDAARIRLHMSEVHGNVMDKLYQSGFLEKLSGEVFLSQHEAMQYLLPEEKADAA